MPFIETCPSREDYWRAIVLFGRNVASYKFALAKSLLEFVPTEPTFVRLEELAVPFSKHVAEHLKRVDKQATSSTSRFLEVCRKFNRGELDDTTLVQRTVALGFENVIDAFHVVNRAPIPVQFFADERKQRGGITITDELLMLKETVQFQNLPSETEARWRLVESAWALGLNPKLLSVNYDPNTSELFVRDERRERIQVTSSRDALDGYQKGRCFYCLRDISIEGGNPNLADVDHFLPHTLSLHADLAANLDGVWNLVLACRECNRGANGKSARVPKLEFLERLHQRNSYLIESHHPLRETLMAQTGATESLRRQFLQRQYSAAKALLVHDWAPAEERAAAL